jgi:thiosulfate reductase cytochrome b subunit
MKPLGSYVYRGFERFWHWTQAALILLLGLTGFEIHGSFQFFGYGQAVAYHNAAAMGLLVLIAFAVFWHFTTGEWRQYVPTRRLLRAQIEYYLTGIFRDAPHPTRKTAANKLNPLQKLVYLGLKVLVIPVMVVSGLLYMFYRYPQRHGAIVLGAGGLRFVALLHTAGAFFVIAFVVGHIYLTTTGQSPVSNLKAMLTGHEKLDGPVTDSTAPIAAVAHLVKEQA